VNLIVGETLAKIAEKRATPTYLLRAKRALPKPGVRRAKNLSPLPPRDNLQSHDDAGVQARHLCG